MYHFIIHVLHGKEYFIEHAGVVLSEDTDEALMLLAENFYDGIVPEEPRRVVALRWLGDRGGIFEFSAPASKLEEFTLSGKRGMFGVYPSEV